MTGGPSNSEGSDDAKSRLARHSDREHIGTLAGTSAGTARATLPPRRPRMTTSNSLYTAVQEMIASLTSHGTMRWIGG